MKRKLNFSEAQRKDELTLPMGIGDITYTLKGADDGQFVVILQVKSNVSKSKM